MGFGFGECDSFDFGFVLFDLSAHSSKLCPENTLGRDPVEREVRKIEEE